MKSIIPIHHAGHELRADSREVARFFDADHRVLFRLISDNLSSFEAICPVCFENAPRADGVKGGDQPKHCMLTEAQVGFLLTLTRNTPRTKELKLQLIQSFQQARAQLRPIDAILLSLPEDWRKVFPDDFYSALLKLYGDEFKRSVGTPSWVGKWTNKYVYQPLWENLPLELKAKRKARVEDGSSDAAYLKLHQFLETHAKQALERHVLRVTVLLQAAASPENFRELHASVFHGSTQLLLGALGGKAA